MSVEGYDRLFRAVGEASANLTLLEHLVHDLSLAAAWVADPMVSGDRKARQALHIALLNQKKLGDKVACARAMMHLALGPGPLFDRANQLLKEVNHLSERRNRFVHDMWHLDDDTGRLFRSNLKTVITKNGDLHVLPTEPANGLSFEDVEALAQDMRTLWGQLVGIENELAGLARDPG